MHIHPKLRRLSPWWLATVAAVVAAAFGIGGDFLNIAKWLCLAIFVLAACAWLVDVFRRHTKAAARGEDGGPP